jgi:hypothetical protein
MHDISCNRRFDHSKEHSKLREERTMKLVLKGVLFGALVILLAGTVAYAQPIGQTPYCPYCGRSFSGGGYVPPGYYAPQNLGPVYGRGMMGGEYLGRGDVEYWPRVHSYRYMPRYERVEPMAPGEAKDRVQEWVDATDNPNIKVGGVEDKGDYYIVSVVTKKEGSLVDEIKVYKYTGDMRFVRVKPH